MPQYETLLAHASTLPEPVLRGAFSYAASSDDRSLLRGLVAREDAPADLAYSHSRTPALAGVFQGRLNQGDQRDAGLTGTRGSRTAMLAKSLAGGSPPHSAVREALASFEVKPTGTLADALARLDAALFTAQQAFLVCTHAGAPTRAVQLYGRPDLVARLGPDLGVRLLAQTNQMWVVVSFANLPDVPGDVLAAAFARAAGSALARSPHAPAARDLADQFSTLFKGRDSATWDALEGAFSGFTRTEFTASLLQGRKWAQPSVPSGVWDERPATLPAGDQVVTVRELPEPMLFLAATGTDPDALHEVTETVVGDPIARTERIVVALLANPHLRVVDRHLLLGAFLEPGVIEPRCRGVMATFDGVSAFWDDPVASALWAQHFPSQVLEIHGWEPFGGRQAAPGIIRRWVHEPHPETSDYEMQDVWISVMNCGVRPAEVLELDRVAIGAAGRARPHGARTFANVYSQLLADALGDNPEAWAAYNSLEKTFTGTVGELLDTCTTIGA